MAYEGTTHKNATSLASEALLNGLIIERNNTSFLRRIQPSGSFL